ncbi:MAG TPA: serine hydrolase [Candidatus Dormibacteraeota bacterium]|nr:serine hydrolase [Candidatus Dormibacteraeota bacterium]
MGQPALAITSRRVMHAAAGDRLSWSMVVLAVLDGFVGLTAAAGAATVHTLPDDIYRYHYLYGPLAPTIGLGLLAAISLFALYFVVTRGRFAAAISIVAGVALVIFELVESFTVGSLLTPPVGLDGSGRAALWLQPFYVGVGVAMVVLGGRAASRARRLTRLDAFTGSVAKAAATVLVALTVGAGFFYGWASTSTATSMYARFFAWGDGTTYDWSRFPSRPLPASTSPYYFAQAPHQYDLRSATGSANPDQFLTNSDSTALLVIQHGRLVLEQYFNGADRSNMITAFSTTKSWNSALVGAAIAGGYIRSVDDPVTAYIPELARKDPRFGGITIRMLLEMRSGLGFDGSGLLENDDSVLYNTTALRQAVLDRVRIANAPGTVFFYNDFNPLLIGMVLERATGRTVTQWLDQTLWQPMGAQYPGSFSIDSRTGGFEKMPSGLNGRPIDLMRLGVLYLNGGSWQGAQLVPAQWVAETTDPANATPAMLGLSYTMGWWTRIFDGNRVYFAWGNHGEYVMVVPSLDIVVGRFGRQYGLGAPAGASGGGTVGHEVWPQVLARVAATVAASSP